ncbi:MAG: FAD-binding oxidoreductase [Patescibacteria group bacterium]
MLLTYKTILTKKTQLNSNTHLYHFDLLEPKEIIFEPGQYVMLKVPSEKGPVSRLYSIASPNTIKNSFELIIGIIPGGLASNYLFSLKENTEVIFYGPAGVFGLKENDRTKIFLVTGTGIAPILSIIKSNFQFSIFNFQLFWGLKNYQDVYIFDELKQLNNETMKQFEFKICLSREQNLDMIPEEDRKYFKLGHIDKVMEEELNNEAMKQSNNFEFYLCGGRTAVESLRLFLSSKNIPKENIYFEKF